MANKQARMNNKERQLKVRVLTTDDVDDIVQQSHPPLSSPSPPPLLHRDASSDDVGLRGLNDRKKTRRMTPIHVGGSAHPWLMTSREQPAEGRS